MCCKIIQYNYKEKINEIYRVSKQKKDLLIFVHRVRSGIENLSFCGKIIGLATETEDDGERYTRKVLTTGQPIVVEATQNLSKYHMTVRLKGQDHRYLFQYRHRKKNK